MATNKTLDVFNPPSDTRLNSGDGLQMDFSQTGKFCLRGISNDCSWSDVFPNDAAPDGNQPLGSQWPGTGKYATCTLPSGKDKVVITFSSAGSNETCPGAANVAAEGVRAGVSHTITVSS